MTYPSTFFQQRKRLRTLVSKIEKLQNELKDPNILELLDNARIDLSNALNIANAVRKKRVHYATKNRVLKLIVEGVTIKKISIQCNVSEQYISQLMRANKINRYQPRKLKCI